MKKKIIIVGTIATMFALPMSMFVATFAFASGAVVPAITTTVQNGSNVAVTSADIGSSVSDSVTVASSSDATSTPTGTVNFSMFPDTTCTGTATSQSGVALLNGLAQSSTTTVPNTGLSYLVNYNGDATYAPATSTCEVVTAMGTSTAITTVLSTTTAVATSSVFDTATLSGTTANAGGTVAYTAYTDNACTLGAQSAGSETVTNGVVPNSNSIQFATPGTYYWQAVYSGDVNNPAATSTCGSEVLNVSSSAPTQGNIVVNEVTNPSGNTSSFQFNTTGAGYSSFSLTGQSAANNQTLNPGTYTISEASSTGWTLASSACSINSGTSTAYAAGAPLVLSAGETISCTFMNVEQGTTTTPGTASITGTVYNDLNRDGIFDNNEPTLSGWTINLYDSAGWSGPTNIAPFMTTVSGANGTYSFSNLPDGTYSIEEINQASLNQFTSDYSPVVITNGVSITGENFGNVAGNPYSNSPKGNKGGDNGHGGDNQGNNGNQGNHNNHGGYGNHGGHK